MEGAGGDGAGGGGVNQEEMDRIKADMEAEVRRNEEQMEEMKRSWEEKQKEMEKEYQVCLLSTQLHMFHYSSEVHVRLWW